MVITLPRCQRLATVACLAAAAGSLSGVNAFSTPSADLPLQITSLKRSVSRASIGSKVRSAVFLAAQINDANDANNANNNEDEIILPDKNEFDMNEFTRPLLTTVTSVFLATSLLFSNPLLPPPDAQAAQSSSSSSSSPVVTSTATSIDIDVRSLPALTRKAIVNRDKLTTYLIDSFKSFKPILDLLSESDTVTVRPPANVKGAINQALTKGEADFLVNGESVDVRIESVPGVVVVRIINPNIPRLPFLKDGTAALQFVDGIVDEAPKELEKAAEEMQAIEKFLMWGAPQKAPIQYKGSSLDYFLSNKFLWNGKEVSLGELGELTNSEVVLLAVGGGVVGAYSASYSYYVSSLKEAEREATEKKEKAAAKKKAKAAAADAKKKKAADAEKEEEKVEESDAAEKGKSDGGDKKAGADKKEVDDSKAADEKAASDTEADAVEKKKETTSAPPLPGPDASEDEETSTKGRKRDAFKNLFRRGGKTQ